MKRTLAIIWVCGLGAACNDSTKSAGLTGVAHDSYFAVVSDNYMGATSISLLWSASLDNFGVAGYELFLNGNKVGTTTATSYTFASLSCGTSYTLAVNAFDSAGNRSQRSSLWIVHQDEDG